MITRLILIPLLCLFSLFSNAETTNQTELVEKTKTCFVCKGVGREKCSARCVQGKRTCPAPCLKPNVGRWEKMDVPGHGPDELWQSFAYKIPGGKSGSTAWTQAHCGEVIEAKPGKVPVNKGRCTVCGGTMKIECPSCAGEGTQPCSMCKGKKVVPESWTEKDNPKANIGVTFIKLKDGRTIRGKILMRMENRILIKNERGELIETTKDQILPEIPAK